MSGQLPDLGLMFADMRGLASPEYRICRICNLKSDIYIVLCMLIALTPVHEKGSHVSLFHEMANG
jgi:hypothetical protein